ncbi:MAG: molybdopterin molybdenumtransferase MoeA [Planctomycetota bacterium]|nr:MAG: molybdopterin molybdenumtransferase MoeA [Planctomycetota bacterium]
MALVSFDEALRCTLAAARARQCPAERVRLARALGRVLRAPVCAERDLPPCSNAAMDGYAVRSAELRAASGANAGAEGGGAAAVFALAAELRAGEPAQPLLPGHAAPVATGAPLPPQADQVVELESSRLLGGGRVELRARAAPGRHVRLRGEDARAGQTVLAAGTVLGPAELALAAACGAWELEVAVRARAGVLTSGAEVVPPWACPGPTQVRDADGPALAAALAECGAVPVPLGHAPDEPAEIAAALAAGLAQGCTVLVSAGGASVGARDAVPAAAARLGFRPLYRGVAMRPGHPVALFARGPALLFALPGNPVAALVAFWVLVRPALRALAGAARPAGTWIPVCLPERIVERPGRVHFLRARLVPAPPGEPGGGLRVAELLPAGSGRLVPLVHADALLRVQGELAAGTAVPALLLREPGAPAGA